MVKNLIKNARGFTLIEILVVIGIIAILATIVIVAINPARQFKQANDTTRQANVNAILNAIGQQIADNKGVFSAGLCSAVNLTSSYQTVYSDNSGGAGTVDLSCLVPTYITALPTDPTGSAPPNTGYQVLQDSNGRISVKAPSAQITIPIVVTR